MDTYELFLKHSYIIWGIIGVFLVILEMFLPGILLLFFGVGALITALFCYLTPVSFGWQITIWLISSILSILAGGHFLRSIFPAYQKYDKKKEDEYAGEITQVVKKVKPSRKGGRVLFQGVEWDAISAGSEINEGSFAKIISRDNLTFIVKEISKEEGDAYMQARKRPSEEE